jgi:hypothetical protein
MLYSSSVGPSNPRSYSVAIKTSTATVMVTGPHTDPDAVGTPSLVGAER